MMNQEWKLQVTCKCIICTGINLPVRLSYKHTQDFPPMSTLHHEALYETCFDESYEEYMNISGLSSKDLDNWIKINPFVQQWIENKAIQKFEDLCQ